MNSLDIARQGRSAARQIRSQLRAGVLTPRELDRLLIKVEDGFEQMMGEPAPPPIPADLRGALTLLPGGRA